MTPSRQFMIQQAILNAAWGNYPMCRIYGVPRTLRQMKAVWDDFNGVPTPSFLAAIHAEFHKLAQKYEVQI